MKILKTALTVACILTGSASTLSAQTTENGAVVISDLIGVREIGPDFVTIAVVGGLLAILSATSASSTSN